MQYPILIHFRKNSMNHKIEHKDGEFISTKKDTILHGYGISIVQDITKKYDGFATFKQEKNSFVAKAALCVITE